MRCRELFLLGLTFWALASVGGCAVFADHAQRRGEIIEKWQTENKKFKIRVTAYEEKGANVNGAYYVFESGRVGTSAWHEILTFRHDDQPKIPTSQVRFVDDQLGYFFMGWVYAVTTDGGITWSVWDAAKDLSNWQCCNYQLIQNAEISQDGTGSMKLKPIENRRGEVPELHTVDYGKHWRVE